MWRNDIKYKYMFPLKNLARKGLSHWVLVTPYGIKNVVIIGSGNYLSPVHALIEIDILLSNIMVVSYSANLALRCSIDKIAPEQLNQENVFELQKMREQEGNTSHELGLYRWFCARLQ